MRFMILPVAAPKQDLQVSTRSDTSLQEALLEMKETVDESAQDLFNHL